MRMTSPEDPIERRAEEIIDDSANKRPELDEATRQAMLRAHLARQAAEDEVEVPLIEDVVRAEMSDALAKMLEPGGHIAPSPAERALAIDVLKSDWIGELVELDEDDRAKKLEEMAVDAAHEESSQLPVLRVLLNSDEVTWMYIGESLEQGPEARIWDTTHWIIANAVARQEHEQQNPPATE